MIAPRLASVPEDLYPLASPPSSLSPSPPHSSLLHPSYTLHPFFPSPPLFPLFQSSFRRPHDLQHTQSCPLCTNLRTCQSLSPHSAPLPSAPTPHYPSSPSPLCFALSVRNPHQLRGVPPLNHPEGPKLDSNHFSGGCAQQKEIEKKLLPHTNFADGSCRGLEEEGEGEVE